jgi:hypothetical protein
MFLLLMRPLSTNKKRGNPRDSLAFYSIEVSRYQIKRKPSCIVRLPPLNW